MSAKMTAHLLVIYSCSRSGSSRAFRTMHVHVQRLSRLPCFKRSASRKSGQQPRTHSPHLTPAHCDPAQACGERHEYNEISERISIEINNKYKITQPSQSSLQGSRAESRLVKLASWDAASPAETSPSPGRL